jgi:cell division protein FtsL
MTFIQPKKYFNIQNFMIAALVVLVLGSTFWLVIGYNETVNLSHNIASVKSQLETIGAQNTALNNNVLALLGENQIGAVAAADGLVQDTKPQYFSINQQWPIASQSSLPY